MESIMKRICIPLWDEEQQLFSNGYINIKYIVAIERYIYAGLIDELQNGKSLIITVSAVFISTMTANDILERIGHYENRK